ncbi:MAG: 4Fe-4S double cluster binding domain-containing protein [Desulfobacter sp.]
MASESNAFPAWLGRWMDTRGIQLWGAADLCAFTTPRGSHGGFWPAALSFVLPMNPRIMAGIQDGPNQTYADEYARVNTRINNLSAALAKEISTRGYRAAALAASERTDTANIKGDFPQKTAATQAGLGWIGRHCQLITRPFGSWVRLGTIFTDMPLPCGPATEKNFCGKCRRCVDACPANALTGNGWQPGVPREAILDAKACDDWKKKHYYQYHKGHNCGICSAVCPYGLKTLKTLKTSQDVT